MAKLREGARHCAELYAALQNGARHCNSALSLSFLVWIFSGAAKAPWRPAPERIRSKNERLSAQSFTRRYEMVRCCNSALSLSFLLRILSGAAKAPWRPAPERIRSKNERLSAQSFTRRYEMVRNTVTDRAPRAFKEQALGSRRAERASEPRKGRPQRASEPNTKPGGVRVVCALRFFMSTKRICKKSSGATRARSLCFMDIDKSELGS